MSVLTARTIEGRNPPRSPAKCKGECGVCGKTVIAATLVRQRGVLVCRNHRGCLDNPRVFRGVLGGDCCCGHDAVAPVVAAPPPVIAPPVYPPAQCGDTLVLDVTQPEQRFSITVSQWEMVTITGTL